MAKINATGFCLRTTLNRQAKGMILDARDLRQELQQYGKRKTLKPMTETKVILRKATHNQTVLTH